MAPPTVAAAAAGSGAAWVIYRRGELFSSEEAVEVYEGDLTEVEAMRRWASEGRYPLLDRYNVAKEDLAVQRGIAIGRFFTPDIDESVGGEVGERYAAVRQAARQLRGKVWFFREHISIRGFLMRDFSLDPTRSPCLGLEFVAGPHRGSKYDYDMELSFDSGSIADWVEDVLQGRVEPAMRSLPLPTESERRGAVKKVLGGTSISEVSIAIYGHITLDSTPLLAGRRAELPL